MKYLILTLALSLASASAFSEDWRVVNTKDEIRGTSATMFYVDGSAAGTSFGIVCFNRKFDHIELAMGKVIDYENNSILGPMVTVKYKRDDAKPAGFHEQVSKDSQSVLVGKRYSRKMIAQEARKLVIEVPLFGSPDLQTSFSFPDFKPVVEACEGLF